VSVIEGDSTKDMAGLTTITPMYHLLTDGKSAKEAVMKGLDNLETIIDSIDNAYKDDLANGDYERYEPKVMNMEAVQKLARGEQEDGDAAMETATA